MEGNTSSTDESTVSDQSAPPSGGWRFPALLLVVLVGVAFYAIAQRPVALGPGAQGPGYGQQPDTWTPSQLPTAETVSLVIDFGNGAIRQFNALPWSSGMTVADVMEAARTFRPGIRYTQQGTGASGFLSSLEGVGNEGTQGRNWRYLVDDRLGETSFCLAKVEPGSSVLWEYSEEY